MQLTRIGPVEKYQVESLIKTFLPVVRFSYADAVHAVDTVGSLAENWIVLRHKQGKQRTYLLAVFHCNGSTRAAHQIVCNQSGADEKNLALCRALYRLLCQQTGQTPAWGMLTGVRPVKRVRKMQESGLSKTEVAEQLGRDYFVSPKKAALCWETAQLQKEMQVPDDPRAVHLYISIPFCPTRCHYCSFVSQAISRVTPEMMESYVTFLCREIAQTAQLIRRHQLPLLSIYIGGGTPTTLSAAQLTRLLLCLQQELPVSQLREYTVEAGRPDTITCEKLEVLLRFGVDRISINPQTFSDQTLQKIGRQHTSKQTLEAFAVARQMGFANINMDLIAGLPGETQNDFWHTIKEVFSIQPDSITVHALAVKRSSTLYEEGKTIQGDWLPEVFAQLPEQMRLQEYRPYYLYRQKSMVQSLENVGYARPGKASLYNVAIMEENQTVLAVGAGGSTKLVGDKITRIFNHKYPKEYIENFEQMLKRKGEVELFYDRTGTGWCAQLDGKPR